MTTDLTLAEAMTAIQERVSAATEGPWDEKQQDVQMSGKGWYRFGPANAPKVFDSPSMYPADATFIAHARTDVEWMARALQAVVDAINARDDQMRQNFTEGSRVAEEMIANGGAEIPTSVIRRAIEGAFQAGGAS